MRSQILLKSVRRLLDADESVVHVATMWRRHHWGLVFSLGAFVVLFVVAVVAGVTPLGSQIAIGLAGLAVASLATNDQRILVQTDRGLVMMQSSRIRQKAIKVIGRLAPDTPIEIVSDNLVISDWIVGDQRFSMMKRSQRSMTAIAGR